MLWVQVVYEEWMKKVFAIFRFSDWKRLSAEIPLELREFMPCGPSTDSNLHSLSVDLVPTPAFMLCPSSMKLSLLALLRVGVKKSMNVS